MASSHSSSPSDLLTSQAIKDLILANPRVADWPEMAHIVRSGGQKKSRSIACWEYPQLACEAVGGRSEDALPAMAAITCLLTSIHLIDDMLDEDPDGAHHHFGWGPTANLAAAFQSVAGQLIGEAPLSAEHCSSGQMHLAKAGLATAVGQYLDTTPLGDRDPEAAYWEATAAKTPPLFGTALYLGALCGDAEASTAEAISDLALTVGKVVQAGDDMTDALAVPAKPDWTSRWNNLVILYAQEARHDDQERFVALLDDIDTSKSGTSESSTSESAAAALAEAQQILVRSGAISFGCYHVIEGYREACDLLRSLDLPHPEALGRLLESLVQPSRELFASHNIEPPEALLSLEAWR